MKIRLIKSNEYAIGADSDAGADVINRPLKDVFTASGLDVADDFDGFAKKTHSHTLTEIFGDAVNEEVEFKKQVTLSVPDGTAPLVVTSTTQVDNLNAEMIGGKTLDDIAQKATTLEGYGITDAYTKDETYSQDEVDTLIAAVDTGGNGSVALPYPDAAPDSPSDYDDEFNSSTLDTKWTVDTALTAPNSYDINTTAKSWLIVKDISTPGTALQISQAFASPAGTAFSMTCKLSNLAAQAFNIVRIFAQDAGDSNWVSVGVQYNSTLRMEYRKKVSGSETDNITPISWPNGSGIVHLQRNTSNSWSAYISNDGISWLKNSTDISLSFDVAKIGIVLDTANTTKGRLGVDWFRVNWLTL